MLSCGVVVEKFVEMSYSGDQEVTSYSSDQMMTSQSHDLAKVIADQTTVGKLSTSI